MYTTKNTLIHSIILEFMRQLVHLLAVDVLVQKLNLTKKTSQLIIKTIKFN